MKILVLFSTNPDVKINGVPTYNKNVSHYFRLLISFWIDMHNLLIPLQYVLIRKPHLMLN